MTDKHMEKAREALNNHLGDRAAQLGASLAAPLPSKRETAMTMVETVARAIMVEDGCGLTNDAGERVLCTDKSLASGGFPHDQCPCSRGARAAIAAMSEPDDAFLKALTDRMHDARFSKSGETYPIARNFIRSLVDAALSEEQP